MQWIHFQIGLWNGWWFSLVWLVVVYGVTALYPKDVARRQFGMPEFNRTERLIAYIQFVLCFGIIVYAVFVPLKLGTAWFWTGLVIFGLGMVGYTLALASFASTPLNEPVVKGLYRISRHPIYMTSSFLAWIGVGLATASWIIILTTTVGTLLMHNSVLAEERLCLAKYGEAYRKYMQKVPRYFLFF